MRFFLAILFLTSATQVVAQEQDQANTRRFSYDFKGNSIKAALEIIILDAGLGIGYTSELVRDKTTNCTIEDATAKEVLLCIVNGSDLDIEEVEGGSFRLIKKPLPSTETKASKHTLSGYIRDAQSGEALIYATIYDRKNAAGATSNAYGFYSLTLPAGEVSLVASYLGYERDFFNFDLRSDRKLDINLNSSSFGLDTLVVVSEVDDPIEERTQMGIVNVPIEQIMEMPTLLGEPDVLRAVQLLPGIQSGNEGTTGLYVRGGSVDQNLFLLDGATVYNPSHLFGFLSIFHARALNDVTLIKGGFPARYGGRLSSVVDISMKEGNMKEFAGEASFGRAASSLTIEGPIKKDKSSFILSGRRSLIDWAIGPFADADDYPAYALFDFNAKVNHRFSQKDRLYASVYGGSDRYKQVNRFEGNEDGNPRNLFGINWGNTIATLRWNHLFSDKLFSNTSLLYSRYNLDTEQDDVRFRRTETELIQERFRLIYNSGVEDIGGRIDFEFIPSPQHYVRFGGQVTGHTFSTGTLQLNDGPVDSPRQDTLVVPVSDINTTEAAAYLEDDISIGRFLGLNLGLRASMYSVGGATYSALEPRISTRLSLPFGWSIKASYARMSQYIHLLVNSGLGLPTDLWLPATARIEPQESEQFSVGLAHTTASGYVLSIEAYDKKMKGVIEYREGASFLGVSQDWQDNIESGEGHSYGIEVFLQKKKGRTTGWFGYTLSWSDRTFENLNDGKTFPFRYDRRHDVSLTLVHRLKEWVSISGSWVYGSGNAVTVSTARFSPAVLSDISSRLVIPAPNAEVEYLSERNGFRMPAYHRLDLGVNFEWPAKKRGTHLVSLGAYNTYNRRNPYFLFTEENRIPNPAQILDDTEIVLKQASLFPLLPSFSYAIQF